jgi:23S rRNA (uridine2552-2'-O)-methyltransferase
MASVKKIWLKKHIRDPWVRSAQKDGYRSRAAYKLLEIHQKDQLFKRGQFVIDLGASPGGWSQVAASLVGQKGRLLAVDLLPMEPIEGVEFFFGDFSDPVFQKQLHVNLQDQKPTLIISDMAPNISGNRFADQSRIFELAKQALRFCETHLAKGGSFLIKVFQGEDFAAYLSLLRKSFKSVAIRKPKASRSGSNEIFLLAKVKL